jgi:DNA repair protein RadA/Sms
MFVAKTKTKTVHKCSTCGEEVARWAGRCPGCGDWNTLIEMAPMSADARPQRTVAPTSLKEAAADPSVPMATGVSELDRVLGGGLVRGSVSLLGGEPGIGKSTLILQLCAAVASKGGNCLIATGEESLDQVGRRAQRLGADNDRIMLVAESEVEVILAVMQETKPQLVIIDSVQTMHSSAVNSSAGTVTQVRDSAAAFTAYAKEHNVATIMVGHVTKEGSLAGPRVLEHMVDTVIEFEGDRHHELRFLRTVKHRFGATDEIGVLEMTAAGLQSVPDASALFLDDRQAGVPGSVVVPTVHGRRPVLVEIQSLVTSETEVVRRIAQGVDPNRVSIVGAILGKHTVHKLGKHDVYVSVLGGLRIDDPGVDLAIATAIASSFSGDVMPADTVAIGELGLSGEVRKASHMQKRLMEAQRMGFKRAVVSKNCPAGPPGLELKKVDDVGDALGIMIPPTRRKVRKAS